MKLCILHSEFSILPDFKVFLSSFQDQRSQWYSHFYSLQTRCIEENWPIQMSWTGPENPALPRRSTTGQKHSDSCGRESSAICPIFLLPTTRYAPGLVTALESSCDSPRQDDPIPPLLPAPRAPDLCLGDITLTFSTDDPPCCSPGFLGWGFVCPSVLESQRHTVRASHSDP